MPTINVFQVMGTSSATGYGILMQSSTDFSVITDTSTVSQCVWRGSISFSGTWTIPTDIPDRDNCIVFAH
ncbi:DUF6453 family protein [Erwinia endophytica]|uniref:DUF6453 family protein n=1 Tax=Erwinia endophytica TaxID=1563158 RepID=UPI003B84852F